MRKFSTDYVEDELSYAIGKEECNHPGKELKRVLLLSDTRITNDMLADATGVSRVSINKLLNSAVNLSTTMALRLEQAGLGSAAKWLQVQNLHELEKLRRKDLGTKRMVF